MTETPKTYIRSTWKLWLLALSAAAVGVLFLSALGGCSTIEGFAHDMADMSKATRGAMTED